MKKKIAFFMLLSMGLTAHTQYTHFNENFTAGGYSDYISSDSIITVVGMAEQNNIFGISWNKVDLTGNTLDQGFSPFLGNVEVVESTANPDCIIIKMNDTTFVGIGISGCSSTYSTPFVYFFNHNFEILWQHQYSEWSNCIDQKYYSIGLTKVNENEFMMLNWARHWNNSPITIDSIGYRLTKINMLGEVLSDSLYWPEEVLSLDGIKKTEEGYAIFGSRVLEFVANPCVAGVDYDPFILYINESAEPIDSFQLTDIENVTDGYVSIEITSQNLAIVGQGCYYEMDCETNRSLIRPGAFLLDITTMDTIWNYVYNIPELESNWIMGLPCRDIIAGTDGGYLIVFNLQNVEPQGYVGSALLLKVSDNGELEWFRFFQSPDVLFSIPQIITQCSDGGYALSGYTMWAKGPPFWVVKLDACGNEVENGCPPITGIQDSSIQD